MYPLVYSVSFGSNKTTTTRGCVGRHSRHRRLRCHFFFFYFFLICLPLTLPERPTGDYPQRHHEHEQHGARAYGHERLQHEPRVEVDPV